MEECHSDISHSDPVPVQSVRMQMCEKIRVTVHIQEFPCEIEVDPGSALSIISRETFHWICAVNRCLEPLPV